MRTKIIFLMILTALASLARADEKFPVLHAGSEVYSNVVITKVSTTDVFFTHSRGMANVKIKTLSPELQKHFNFDPAKAQAVEQKRAANDTNYHNQLIHQAAVRPPDMTREKTPAAPAAQAIWRNDYSGALKQAKSENKLVLLNFTGSDWCPSCIAFTRDVLSTEKFAAYAGGKLQLVKVDFPKHTPLPEAQRQANAALSEKFLIEAFPTYVLLDSSGKELGRQIGYLNGGPNAFIAELEQFSGR